jgi:hypothetical protein
MPEHNARQKAAPEGAPFRKQYEEGMNPVDIDKTCAKAVGIASLSARPRRCATVQSATAWATWFPS